MKVREEIEKYADPEEREILLWLFERNHWQSEWSYVSFCEHRKYGTQSYETHRVWHPQPHAMRMYFFEKLVAASQAVLSEGTEINVESGIGVHPERSPSAKALEALFAEMVKHKCITTAPTPTGASTT